MTEIDSQLVSKKLGELRDYLQKLLELDSLDEKTFVSDYHHFGLAEHYLQLAIESILDICRHLIVGLALKAPDDAHGLFPLLEKEKILSEDFVKRNEKMPGFRNRLVHGYSEIDHHKTYTYLKNHLGDLENFAKQISRYLLKNL